MMHHEGDILKESPNCCKFISNSKFMHEQVSR